MDHCGRVGRKRGWNITRKQCPLIQHAYELAETEEACSRPVWVSSRFSVHILWIYIYMNWPMFFVPSIVFFLSVWFVKFRCLSW